MKGLFKNQRTRTGINDSNYGRLARLPELIPHKF